MVVGVLTLELFLGEAATLKDKRRVLKSLLEKVKNRFNVAVAEVDRQDQYKFSTVGISCVSNSSAHAYSILQAVVKFVEEQGTVEIIEMKTEVFWKEKHFKV